MALVELGKPISQIILAKKLKCPVFHLDDFGDDYHPFVGIPGMIEAVQSLDDDIVIIEGIGVFDERFDFLHPFRVYVDTPDTLRAERARSRDKPTASRSSEDWEKIYQIWETETSDYINQSSSRADVIVKESDVQVADFIIDQMKSFRKHIR